MPIKHEKLEKIATQTRIKTLDLCVSGGGHLASAFSCVDILVALYCGGIMRIDFVNPKGDDRDRFILSKGHAASALYVILSAAGFFPEAELADYGKGLCKLGAHPDKDVSGIEATTGSLGHGLGIACGISLAAKMDSKDYKSFVLLGDGECSEGQIWEAALFASRHKLDNLIGIVDRNRLCVTDFTEDCICLDPLSDKWESFGWDVCEINGHSFDELIKALSEAKNKKNGKPKMIIAGTVKGKGVSFIENNPIWHTKIPFGKQIDAARKELDSKIA